MIDISKKSLEDKWKYRFQKYAEKYENEAYISGWSEHSLNRRITTFKRSLNSENPLENSLILDLGCGAGTYCRIMADLGYRVVGVDYSIGSIKKARQLNYDKSIVFNVAEAYHLPFKDKSFDIVICIGVLQTLSNEKNAFIEIDRILKSDGILFLDTLNNLCITEFTKRLKFITPVLRNPSDIQNFSLKTYNPFSLKKNFKRSNYRKVKIVGVYIFPNFL